MFVSPKSNKLKQYEFVYFKADVAQKFPIAKYRGVAGWLIFDLGVVESWSQFCGVVESWTRGVVESILKMSIFQKIII